MSIVHLGGEADEVVVADGALELEAGEGKGAVVERGRGGAARLVVDGDVEVELLEGPGVGLGHVLARRRDVGLGREEAAQPHHAALQRRGSFVGETGEN